MNDIFILRYKGLFFLYRSIKYNKILQLIIRMDSKVYVT